MEVSAGVFDFLSTSVVSAQEVGAGLLAAPFSAISTIGSGAGQLANNVVDSVENVVVTGIQTGGRVTEAGIEEAGSGARLGAALFAGGNVLVIGAAVAVGAVVLAGGPGAAMAAGKRLVK